MIFRPGPVIHSKKKNLPFGEVALISSITIKPYPISAKNSELQEFFNNCARKVQNFPLRKRLLIFISTKSAAHDLSILFPFVPSRIYLRPTLPEAAQ
jgi:hypothetical protein